MPQSRIDDFKHLFRALEAGCPPHAGLAIGFDRLVAVMQGRDTVRDVIAFPKNSSGEDPMVESPGLMRRKQLDLYHLRIVPNSREQQKEDTLAEEKKDLKKAQDFARDESYLDEYLERLKVLPEQRSQTNNLNSYT